MAIPWPDRESLTRGGLCWWGPGWGGGDREEGVSGIVLPFYPRYLEYGRNPFCG